MHPGALSARPGHPFMAEAQDPATVAPAAWHEGATRPHGSPLLQRRRHPPSRGIGALRADGLYGRRAERSPTGGRLRGAVPLIGRMARLSYDARRPVNGGPHERRGEAREARLELRIWRTCNRTNSSARTTFTLCVQNLLHLSGPRRGRAGSPTFPASSARDLNLQQGCEAARSPC